MSVCYDVKLGMFFRGTLGGLMEDYPYAEREILYRCSDERDAYLLFAKGSIRGISVRQEKKDALIVRCNVLPSDVDIEILHHFLNWMAAKRGVKIIHEEGQRISGELLTLPALREQLAGEQSLNLLEALLSQERYVNLPVWDADVTVYKDTLEELKEAAGYPDNLFTYLKNKAYRIFQARRATQITTKSNVISVWAYDDVLMYVSDLVAVHNPDNHDEHIFLTWDRFFSCSYVMYEEIPISKEQGSYYFIYGIEDGASLNAFAYFNEQTVPMEEL